jgi:RND family efflux transporter MFP subunit
MFIGSLRYFVAILMGGVMAGVLIVAGCGKGAAVAGAVQPTVAPVIPVRVAVTEERDLQRAVRVVGSLAGLESTTLSNRVTGTVDKILVDVGDRVKPGDKLLQIIPLRFEKWLEEGNATLAETLARLGLKEVPDESFDVNQTALVKKAMSELENAKSKLDRQAPLYKQGVVKEFEYFDTESAYKVAQSALESTRDEARALIAQARQQRADNDIRARDLYEATIRAPDGLTPGGMKIDNYAVTVRKASVGEYLKEGTTLFMLVADSTLKLQARVPERYQGMVAAGEAVKFKVEAYAGEEFEGTVSRIDPSVDEANRTFMIEALVENSKRYGNRLRPGSFVQGQILTKVEKGALMVPLEAVTSFVGVTKAFVVEGEKGNQIVHAIEVTTGQQEGGWIEVARAAGDKRELKTGDRVVTDGVTKLVDGGKVEVQER